MIHTIVILADYKELSFNCTNMQLNNRKPIKTENEHPGVQ